jgi:hypothetical protein
VEVTDFQGLGNLIMVIGCVSLFILGWIAGQQR